MIKIQEIFAFGQTVTAVIDEEAKRKTIILDLRKGDVSEHAKECSRYHARRQRQGLIKIERINGPDSHIKAVEE